MVLEIPTSISFLVQDVVLDDLEQQQGFGPGIELALGRLLTVVVLLLAHVEQAEQRVAVHDEHAVLTVSDVDQIHFVSKVENFVDVAEAVAVAQMYEGVGSPDGQLPPVVEPEHQQADCSTDFVLQIQS